MRTLHRQRGMTGVGWLLILMILGFVIYTALKLWPIYYDYFMISSSMNSVTSQSGLATKNPAQIKQALIKQLLINNVRDLDKDDIYVSVEKGNVQLEVAYEVRTPFVGNIDLLVSFENSVSFTGTP